MRAKAVKSAGKVCALLSLFLESIALYSFLSSVVFAAAHPQDRFGREIGSLTASGEVYVNGAATPEESKLFAGDMLRTGGTGTATLTLDGNGAFQIFPNTEMIIAGQPQYVAELKLGKVVMNSSGATGINVRTGGSVVVPLAEGEHSTSHVEAPSDGSFLVSCERGSVGVIPLQGGKGVFIEAGQSARVSAQGELDVIGPQNAPSGASLSSDRGRQTEPAARQRHGVRRWILIGAAVAGAGIAAAILSANGSPASATAASGGSSPGTDPAPSSPAPPSGNPAPPSGDPPSNPTPPPVHGAPPPPTPPAPTPPPSQPAPPGHDCNDHHDKKCSPHVAIGFAFHF